MSSTFTFTNKLCQAVASFAAGWMLKVIAFDTTAAVQSEGTLNALFACRTFIPIAAYVATLVAMHFYPIDKKGEADLQVAMDELKRKEIAVEQARTAE
jgi:GPH family glycoside/pentoside/hexuronide:cation symporter